MITCGVDLLWARIGLVPLAMSTFVRLEIDLDERTATGFALLLHEMNAVTDGEKWTPESLAASLLAHLVTDDMEAHRPSTAH